MNDRNENVSSRSRVLLALNIVVLLNVAVSTVFAVLVLVQAPSAAAGYALVRAVVLLGAGAVVATRSRSGESLLLAWIATAVQLGDTIVGAQAGDIAKTVGPLVLAALTAACALWWMRVRREPDDRGIRS